MARLVTTAVLAIAIGCAAGYYWGFVCGSQAVAKSEFDNQLVTLGNDILVLDFAKVSDISDKAIDVLNSQLLTEFKRMASTYLRYGIADSNSNYVRCVVTRRVRGLVAGEGSGICADSENGCKEVKKYLANECPGESSHKSWVDTEFKGQGKQ